ncbi:MAG: ribosomal protein S18-alanine N-acetyltransferase [Alphaproteobacteria bacterium]|nr:ribosomal protein S18-alanine N-acetyltransferase [Alphaproteobacteria bacterium]
MRGAACPITTLAASEAAATLLAALHQRCFSEGWSPETFSTMIGQPGIFILLARDQGPASDSPLAFLVLRLVVDEAEIMTIGVMPEARRQGLARALMSEATRILGHNRCQSLFLEVAVSNLPAQKLYRGLGFVEVGRRENYYRHLDGQLEDALLLKRVLMI